MLIMSVAWVRLLLLQSDESGTDSLTPALRVSVFNLEIPREEVLSIYESEAVGIYLNHQGPKDSGNESFEASFVRELLNT